MDIIVTNLVNGPLLNYLTIIEAIIYDTIRSVFNSVINHFNLRVDFYS